MIVKKVSIKVSDKYINFVDIFFLDLVSELPEHNGINKYAIELVDDQQPPYKFIYDLRPVVFEILKAFIETNLANKFIKPSKLSVGALILFNWKLNRSFQLYVDYKGLNNLTIKN